MFPVFSILLAYLLGAVPFAIIVTKLMGLKDPRTYGSGNPGATNVLRTGNKVAAVLTLLGDAAKGWFAVWGISMLKGPANLSYTVVALVMVAVFLGHLFPIFLGFCGGKGVATALGILCALSPWLALITLATWLVIAALFHYSSLAALSAALLAPLYYYSFGLWPGAWQTETPVMVALISISLLLIFRSIQ